MSELQDRIASLRETLDVAWKRPDKEKLKRMQEALAVEAKAHDYLTQKRGLTQETIDHFGLGYDEERNAIAIPIYKNGELINIKYRFLEVDKNKYTSEKGAEVWLYNDEGIQKGLAKKAVLIVEGEFDLMSAWQSGINNVVSPASGKDSYGVWIEQLDNIPKVFIAYDNDNAGRETAIKLSEKLGSEKCLEVKYPDGIKDANEFFQSKTKQDFLELITNAQPFYKYQFKGLGEIINKLRTEKNDKLETVFMPEVKIDKDWLLMVSGKSNVGKTGYVLNIAQEFTKKGIPTLVMPFERGVDSVGRRFLEVMLDKTSADMSNMTDEEWTNVIEECVELPLYFAVPKKDDVVDTILKSKRLFGTQVVIVDHLDYLVRQVQSNREAEIANTLQSLKRVAEENEIIMIIVTHIRKIESAGSQFKRKPNIEDLKGSSALYQDPECVVMLSSENEGILDVEVVKNKGAMKSRQFIFNTVTGRLTPNLVDF